MLYYPLFQASSKVLLGFYQRVLPRFFEGSSRVLPRFF